MYFAYGWPKALSTGACELDEEAIFLCQGNGEYVIAVFTASVQVWSGGQHRLKLGELHRSKEQLEEEGPNLRAHWCPHRRTLAVATSNNHLHLYALNVSSEVLWHLPHGVEVKRVNVYLSHSLHLDYGAVRIADLGGDAKSLLVALSNGTMQVFSWQIKLRGQFNPFIAAYEGSRSRQQRSMRAASLSSAASLSRRSLTSPTPPDLSSGGLAANGVLSPTQASGLHSRSSSATAELAGESALLAAAMSALDLPQPTPAQPADVAVASVHYAPAARMLAVVLQDGRCALCRTADSGIHPVEHTQLMRWVYKPATSASPVVVAAALNATAQLLAVGMSHGRVAVYTLQSLLAARHPHSRTSSTNWDSAAAAAGGAGIGGSGGGAGSSSGGGLGQPEPARVLSLADWGYRSAVVGAASVLQWSPDGRVLAVGYADRGMAVWTPSGCRLMCSLRQTMAAPAGGLPSGMAGPPTPPPATLGSQVPSSPDQRLRQQQGGQQQQQAAPPETQQQQGQGQAAADGSTGSAAPEVPPPLSLSLLQQQDSSQLEPAGYERLGSPGRSDTMALLHQNSNLNPSYAPEPGVLEGGMSALAWTNQGYQLLVAETGKAGCLHQLEFARHMQGAHRVVQHSGGDTEGGSGRDEVQAMQAADRVLLITESRQAVNPALRVPASAPSQLSEAEVARPDLVVHHVKLPQQYIEAAYPLMHAAISQDRSDVAVAGTCGMAVYSRRARRWRLFGDATQERNLRVQGLMWLPAGIIAACAHVDGKEGGGAPQLLLYPQYHLDNASLLARLPLKQMPVAMDSAGWHMVLAFAPLEIKLYRVTVEGPLAPSGRPIARLAAVRELSIMGLGNPLQEIALIDPSSLPHSEPASLGNSSDGGGSASSLEVQRQANQGGNSSSSGGADAGGNASWPKLTVTTRPRPTPSDTPKDSAQSAAAGAAAVLGAGEGGEAPQQCVLLRAGGIMSKLDMREGSELLLSDAIECFWLPLSSTAAGGSGSSGGGGCANGVGLTGPTGSTGSLGGPSLSASSSMVGLGRQTSEAELPLPSAGASAGSGGAPATAAAATVGGVPQQLESQQQQQRGEATQDSEGGGGGVGEESRQPPQVEMPWWTYGARGMQLWFPSSLSEPLTPSLRSLTSPTSTGLAAAAAAASTNSTDPELEFDREVYPIGVSLAEVSIIGVTQRTVRSPAFPPDAAQSLCFHPLPESQPVLPCLLRRLLQKGRNEDALELARWHSNGPHFNRSLEWLLFTALEIDSEQQHAAAAAAGAGAANGQDQGQGQGQSSPHRSSLTAAARQQRFNSPYSAAVGAPPAAVTAAVAAAAAAARHSGIVSPRSVGVLSAAALAQRRAGPLLVAAARLISQFPQFPEIVVSVARKTDAALWPSLFAAVGSPGRLCQGLMQTDKLQSAACCLVIVEQIEGSGPAQEAALQLIQAALAVGQYNLATDLLRFLVPPGETDIVLDGTAAGTVGAGGAAAAGTAPGTVGEGASFGAAAAAEAQQQAAAVAAPADQQQQQEEQQAQPGVTSWLWGMFGGGGGSSSSGAPAAPSSQQQAAAALPPPAAQQQAKAAAAAVEQAAEEEEEEREEIEGGGAAGEAWWLTARHAWKLLDAGALREAALLATSLSQLHGGLPALLAATAAEVPEAPSHTTPSAAAIASALFVAANEFAAADQEPEAVHSAETLMTVCQEAGCVNLATALALLLGDQPALLQFAEQYSAVWDDLYRLIANDVHLCGYAPMLSPMARSSSLHQQQHAAAALLSAAAATSGGQ